MLNKLTNSKHFPKFLTFFNVVVLLHFAEHVAQMTQLYLLHWPRPKCLGLLGIPYPMLIHSEWLHYLHALFMLVGIWLIYLSKYNNRWIYITLILAFYHHFEHAQLLAQAITGVNFFNAPKPVTLVQHALGAQRIELHFFYNLMVGIPMVVGLSKSKLYGISNSK